VQVRFVYEAAVEHHRMEAANHDRNLKIKGSRVEVRKLVQDLAETHPALAGPPSAPALDEMIAELHASAPWMRDRSTSVYKALGARYSAGRVFDEVANCLIARVLVAVAKGQPASLRHIDQLIDKAAAVMREPVLR